MSTAASAGAGSVIDLALAEAGREHRRPFPSRPGAALAGQARAIQEAAAYSTRRAAGLVSELLGPGAWQEVILTGGAARSRLRPQILADVLGYGVSVPEHTEAAARGAAILAGCGAGVLPEDPPPGPQPDDAGHAVPGLERAMRPSLAGQRAYDQLYARQRPAGPGFRGAT